MANGNGEIVQILLDCVERGWNGSNTRPPYICRVPSVLRDHSPSSFDPQMVSIGPLHKEDKNVQEFEGLKESYLHDLLDSLHSTPEETLNACVQKVSESIDRIRASYGGLKSYSDADLTKMMVLDGCFILEFCFKHLDNYKQNLPNNLQHVCIATDLILIENQIPFFVLQDLFDCTLRKKFSMSLTKMLLKILPLYFHPFDHELPENFLITDVSTDSTYDHLLAFFHKCYKPSTPADSESTENKTTTIPSVIELNRSGVRFTPHHERNWPMEIKFKPSSFTSSTLLMPTLVIDDTSELVLRNFIALEQTLPQDHYYFTSYACVMDMLIDTPEDVCMLVESEVVVNRLGLHEEAANLINRICKNILVVNSCYTQELEQLNNFYNGYWPKDIAWLRRTYFVDEWNVINLYITLLLFYLAVVQTIFTVLPR